MPSDAYRKQRAGERPRDPSRKVSESGLSARRGGGPVRSLGEIAGDKPETVRDYEQRQMKYGKPKSYMPEGAGLSPKGDIGDKRTAEARKVVPMKGTDGSEHASRYLPFRREHMVGDGQEGAMTPLGVREVPKDEVV